MERQCLTCNNSELEEFLLAPGEFDLDLAVQRMAVCNQLVRLGLPSWLAGWCMNAIPPFAFRWVPSDWLDDSQS